jgi:hypothetical protein
MQISTERPAAALQFSLQNRQLACGGWPALACSSQPSLEATCLAALALGQRDIGAVAKAQDFLLRSQNSNGSWPVFPGDDVAGCWVTSLATLALRDLALAMPARLKGLHWLLNSRGKESHWLWKWKFRTADRHVRFDPDKFGWPWVPDTVSWVPPTAFAILALRQAPCPCDGLERTAIRVECGMQMLLDRACPGGGWNAGNGVVYDSPLAAHADDTAIALLALSHQPEEPCVRRSVAWLMQGAATLAAPWSLSWSILALAAHRLLPQSLVGLLLDLHDLDQVEDNCSLALVCLALDHGRALAAFGVEEL